MPVPPDFYNRWGLAEKATLKWFYRTRKFTHINYIWNADINFSFLR